MPSNVNREKEIKSISKLTPKKVLTMIFPLTVSVKGRGLDPNFWVVELETNREAKPDNRVPKATRLLAIHNPFLFTFGASGC
jgi:hypothetical protein